MPYFRASQLFWLRLPYLWIQSLLWWISIVSNFDIQGNPCWNRTLTYHFSTSISLNHDWTLGGVCSIQLSYWDICMIYSIFTARRNRTICRLGGGCYIHLTKETYIRCIQASLYTAYLFYHIIRQKTIGKSQTNPDILRCPASRYFP